MSSTPAEVLLGIDVGTTMTKAAVVGLDGRELSWGKVPTPWRPVATGAEMDPVELFDAAVRASSAALDAAPAGRVVGVGVTSMAETVILLGPDGSPVTASIAWHDTRGAEEAAELAEGLGRDDFVERTGLPMSSMCTLSKLAWLHRHGDPPWHRALNVADWVLCRLGAEQVSEASLASRTGALSLAERSWWVEALQLAGAPPGLFPPVVSAGQLVGRAEGAIPVRLRGAALTSAGHDHLCVAAGSGATGPGQLLDSCGTAEAVVRAVEPLPGPVLRRVIEAGLSAGWHTLPGRYALLGGQTLGLTLDRVLALLGVDGGEPLAILDRQASGVAAGSLRLVQEHPYSDPFIVGIGPEASPAALWSAALDAVTEGAQRLVRATESIAGPTEEVVLTDGWVRCAGLRRRKRQMFRQASWPALGEAGARGAALFGGIAAGVFDGPENFPQPEEQKED
ncbi:MAG: FGGY-family carbohydrate kinase [Acidimicrobiales bacterium]